MSFKKKIKICVDNDYECQNGIIGLRRDVVMKLIRMIVITDPFSKKKIKSIVAVDVTFYYWIKTRIFHFMIKITTHPYGILFRLCDLVGKQSVKDEQKEEKIRVDGYVC